MIGTWYFCAATQTAPAATQAFIAIVEALQPDRELLTDDGVEAVRERQRLRREALAQLALADPWMRRYAIPDVVAVALRYDDERILAAADSELQDTLATMEPALRDKAGAAWAALRAGLGGAEVATLLRSLAGEVHRRSRRAPDQHPYLDIEDFIPELLTLALLLAASRRDHRVAQEIAIDDDTRRLARAGMAAAYGRRAQLIAVELATVLGDETARRPDIMKALMNPAKGAAPYEPDLLSALARLEFGHPGIGGTSAPRPDAVEKILDEVVTFTAPRWWLRKSRNWPGADDATRRCGLGGPGRPAAIVLWQAVLWELAAEIDPVATAETLTSWWIAPGNPAFGSRLNATVPVPSDRLGVWVTALKELCHLRGAVPTVVAEEGPLRRNSWLAVAVTSPWLERSDHFYVAKPDGPSKFEQSGNFLLLLRLLLATSTAVSLLRSPRVQAPRQLVTLLFHAADVLNDTRHRSYVSDLAHGQRGNRKSPPTMPAPLAGLALHVWRLQQSAGKGDYPELDPRALVEPLLVPLPAAVNQESLLMGEPAQQIVVGWAWDGLSGSIPVAGSSAAGTASEGDVLAGSFAAGRWRTPAGDEARDTLAERVLAAAAGGSVGLASKPVALLRAYLTIDLEVGLTPWNERRLQDGRRVASPPANVPNFWSVLATPALAVADWARYPDLRNKNPKKSLVELALQIERMLAVFREPDAAADLPAYERWLDEFQSVIASISDSIGLPRALRPRLLELFRFEAEGREARRRVLEEVLDTEIEFGLGTPLDRWLLFERLGAATVLPPQLAQALRLRLLRGLYRRRAASARAVEPVDPGHVRSLRLSNRLLNALLQRFLLESGRTQVALGQRPLNEYVPQLWIEAHRAPRIRQRHIELAAEQDVPSFDRRLLVGVSLDPLSGSARLHLLREPQARTPAGVEVLDLHATTELNSGGEVRGVLTAVREDKGWANVGLTDPVEVPLPGQGFEVGDAVSVPLKAAMPAGHSVVGAGGRLGDEPEEGDVRSARVVRTTTAERTRLRVDVDQAESFYTDTLPDRERRLWEPDIACAIAGVSPETVATHARRQGGAWLPVDWRFTEFLAQSPAGTDAETVLRLVYVNDVDERQVREDEVGGGRVRRFSDAPGRCVVMGDGAWLDGAALAERIDGLGADASGLVMYARLVAAATGAPRLKFVPARAVAAAGDQAGVPPRDMDAGTSADPFDDRVSRWRRRFLDGGELEAYLKDDVWRVPAEVPGFPDIEVTGLQGASGSLCRFTALRWGDTEQRTARIRGRLVETRKLKVSAPSQRDRRAGFTRLMDVAKGTRLVLDVAAKGEARGTYHGYTDLGLGVEIEAESLHFGLQDPKDRPTDAFWRRRPLEVTYVTPLAPRPAGRPSAPVPSEDLLDGVDETDRDACADMLSRSPELRGIVIESPHRRGNDALYRVWLDLDVAVADVSLRQASFETHSASVGNLVTGRLTLGGWVFSASQRLIRARALWTVRRERPRGRPVFLGEPVWREERHSLEQDRNRPTIYLSPSLPHAREHLSERGTAENWRAIENSPMETTRIIQSGYERVVVGSEDRVLAGETRYLHAGPDARVVAVDMLVEPVDGDLVALRRIFTLSAGRREAQPVSPVSDDLEGYRQYLAGGREPVVGRLESGGTRVSLQTDSKALVDGKASSVVPLAPGEARWVESDGFRYSTEDIRVVLMEDNGTAVASYRSVPALSLQQYWERHLRTQGAQLDERATLRDNLLYVDRRETQLGFVHRFEWGYGHTVEVAENALSIAGSAGPDWPQRPFHGDRISKVLVRRVSGPDSPLQLDISPRDIDADAMSRIYQEAREKVVHPATLDGDGHDRPRIVELQTRWSRDLPDGDVYVDREIRQIGRVRLSDDAVRELRAVWPAQDGSRRRPRLALLRLREDLFRESGGSQAVFDFVRPEFGIGKDGLGPGTRTFMTAQDIEEITNDVRLTLRADSDLLGQVGGEPLTATVIRRDFSLRHNLLRNLARDPQTDKINPGALRESVYLVEMKAAPDARRPATGRVRGAPGRTVTVLRSRVTSDPSPCFAVLRWRGKVVELELRPNVTFQLEPSDLAEDATDLPTGSTVRVTAQGRKISLRAVLVGDRAYVPAAGRPAIVLPMQNLLDRKDDLERALEGGTFTVAGLPTVIASPSGPDGSPTEIARTLLTTPHPKIGWVVPARQGHRLTEPPRVQHAGRLSFRSGQAIVEGSGRRIPLAQMSFHDAGGKTIERQCRQGSWDYHDVTTTHRYGPDRGQVARSETLPRPARVTDDFVLFNERWSLRYAEHELTEYGLPATDLVDGATGWSLGTRKRHYPVAAPARGVSGRHPAGLWIEQAPGRIVEVTGSMLTLAGPQPAALDDVHWEQFSPGDLVQLSLHREDKTDVAGLLLHRWMPGPRGAFGERVLLPVDRVDRDARLARLGIGGRWALDHPLDGEEDRYAVGRLGWLGSDNTWTPTDQPAEELRRDDVVVLVAASDGGLAVAGMPDVRVGLAAAPWPAWMPAALADPAPLLGLCEGLPVTVEDNSAGMITVSRRLQQDGPPSIGKVIPVELLGVIDPGQVVLRSGARLMNCPSASLIPGLPPELLPGAVEALRRSGQILWIGTDQRGRLTVGLGAEAIQRAGAEVRVNPLAVLAGDTGSGVLCWESRAHRGRWLPEDQVAWTTLTAGQLKQHINRPGAEFGVRILRSGAVSLTATAANEQRIARLALGDPVHVVAVPGELAQDMGGGRIRCLARLYLSEILLDFCTESTDTPLGTEPRACEVEDRRRRPSPRLQVCPQGKRLLAVDLADWMTARPMVPPVSAGRYRTWADAGSGGAERSVDPDEAVLRNALLPEHEWDSDVLAGVARWWLGAHGTAAFGLEERSLSLAPALAAVLVLDAAGRCARMREDAETFAGAAVHLCRQLGLRAARSRHLDPLVNSWWLGDAQRDRGPLWRRLSAIHLEGTVDSSVLSAVRATYDGIGARTTLQPDPELRSVAAGLAATLGIQGDYDDIDDYDGPLRQLVNLGRSLAPPSGRPAAQCRLLDVQREDLTGLLRRVLRGSPEAMTLLAMPSKLQDSGWDSHAERVLRELVGFIESSSSAVGTI